MMDEIKSRNLTIRLSRLTEQEASGFTSASTSSPRPGPSRSSSTNTSRSRSKTIDLSRISAAHRQRQPPGRTLRKRKHNRGGTAAGGSFKASSSSHVKIKMNFFRRRTRAVVDLDPAESPEIEETVETAPESSALKSLTAEKEIPESKGSEHSSSSEDDTATPTEDKDDSSWADDYE